MSSRTPTKWVHFVFLGQTAAGHRMTTDSEPNMNSCLDQVTLVCWHWGQEHLECQQCHLVGDSLPDWQPMELPEKCSAVVPVRPPWRQMTLVKLLCIQSSSQCTAEHGIAVVQPGCDDIARHCLGQVFWRQTVHMSSGTYGSCTPFLCPWHGSWMTGASHWLHQMTSAWVQEYSGTLFDTVLSGPSILCQLLDVEDIICFCHTVDLKLCSQCSRSDDQTVHILAFQQLQALCSPLVCKVWDWLLDMILLDCVSFIYWLSRTALSHYIFGSYLFVSCDLLMALCAVKELNITCHTMQKRVMELIEQVQNEDVTGLHLL